MAIQTITVDLGTAHTNKLYYCQGCQILVEEISGDATLKINHPSSPSISLRLIRQIKTPKQFTKIYITNEAQSGKSLKVKIGLKTDILGKTLIASIDKITEVETVTSIRDTTPKGSEGVAFIQAAASGGAWTSPDGHSDPSSDFINETNVYDDDTATFSTADIAVGMWTDFLYLTLSSPVTADKLRFWVKTGMIQIDIDAKIDAVWTHVYEGRVLSAEQNAWVEKGFTAGVVDQVRIRFWGITASDIYLSEVDVWQVATTGGEIVVTPKSGAEFEVVQGTAAELKATVTQASAARTVTGTVTAEQSTPASLKNQPHGEEGHPFAQFATSPYYMEVLPIGSLGAILQQRASTYELLVQLTHGGVAIDPRILGSPTDGTYIGDIKFGESLPAGTAAIGKLAANSGVDIGDVDVLSLPETGTVTHISATSTEDVKTCDAGHTLKVHGYFFYVSADITAELRFKISGNVIGGLTCEGAVGFNFVGKKCPTGADGEDIEIYLSGSGTVKGFIITEET